MSSVSPARLSHSSLPSSPSLPTCKDDDDVFEFPAVATGPALDTPSQPSITLMTGSAQRISVRLQRATITQATQTEPLWPELSWGGTENGSHTFPKMKYRTHRKASKSKGLACWENLKVQHRPVSSECSSESTQNGAPHLRKDS
ncbi:ras guanyl-releasing protein 3-like isoform X1 [Oryzias latipes]|uniref:ras guanyl-releasing protein 3-like isoform X1 n=1 Tax=Oryzias latipes TaxID=8090 RepID=UPI0009DABD70|nr:ras guanyl-releasing protein 3-like isoform X1 [Oryzias latipes]